MQGIADIYACLERVRTRSRQQAQSLLTSRSEAIVHCDPTVENRPMTFDDTVLVSFNFCLVIVKKSVTPGHARIRAYEHDLDDRERRRARILNEDHSHS